MHLGVLVHHRLPPLHVLLGILERFLLPAELHHGALKISPRLLQLLGGLLRQQLLARQLALLELQLLGAGEVSDDEMEISSEVSVGSGVEGLDSLENLDDTTCARDWWDDSDDDSTAPGTSSDDDEPNEHQQTTTTQHKSQ